MPAIFVENLEKLQSLGLIPSRSEGIRLAIREFLKNEIKTMNLLGFRDKQMKFEEIEEISMYDCILEILSGKELDLDAIAVKFSSDSRKEILEALNDLLKEGLVARNEQMKWIRVIV